jgi:hypothetical protein
VRKQGKSVLSAGSSIVLTVSLRLLQWSGKAVPPWVLAVGLVLIGMTAFYAVSDWIRGSSVGPSGWIGRAVVAGILVSGVVSLFGWWIWPPQKLPSDVSPDEAFNVLAAQLLLHHQHDGAILGRLGDIPDCTHHLWTVDTEHR